MSKLKVIFLSPVAHFKGGAEKSLLDLLANSEIEPMLIAPADGEILEKGKELGIPTHVLPFGKIADVRRPFSVFKGAKVMRDLVTAAKQLKKIAHENDVRIVHSNGLKAHMINCVSRRMGGAKAVVHIRDIPYTGTEKSVWHVMHKLSDAMVLVSRACWPTKTLPKKATVIHNGTALMKQKSRKPNDILTIGFIGRIHPGKGLHLLIKWIAASDIQARLSIRGRFAKETPDYQQDIMTLIDNHNLHDRVDFAGFIENPDDVYNGIDVVVVPSHRPDPLPRAVMESMARGIPVCAYPAGGIPEMIEHKKTGYFVSNAKNFNAALQHLAHHEKEITTAAKAKIADHFTIENLHTGLNALYKRIAPQ